MEKFEGQFEHARQRVVPWTAWLPMAPALAYKRMCLWPRNLGKFKEIRPIIELWPDF